MFPDWLKHAFAIEAETALSPTERQRALIDALCSQVVARGLTTPALILLESVRPLNFVSAQTLQFFAPLLSAIADRGACDELAEFLEHRGSVEFLCHRLQEFERPVPPQSLNAIPGRLPIRSAVDPGGDRSTV